MRKLLIVAAFGCLTAASSAQAETPADAQAALAIGKCIVKADRAAAVGLLKTLPLTGERVDWGAMSLGDAGGCGGSRPNMSVPALRGGLAQELFRRDFVEFGVQPQRAAFDLASFQLPVETNLMGVQDPTKTLFLTADCVARSTPEGAEKLIKSRPGSAQEARIFDNLQPWLSACQGANRMAYGRTELRSAIVQAAYHVSARFWSGQMRGADPAQRTAASR